MSEASKKRPRPKSGESDDEIQVATTRRKVGEPQLHQPDHINLEQGPLRRKYTYDDYTVGWLCALAIERAAAEVMLDCQHEVLPAMKGDPNSYAFGSIGPHNVVIACLPAGTVGTNNAATVATNMQRTFRSLSVRLMVGIGGGVPGKHDIRLGDIVVSEAVVQYDYGKTLQLGTFQRTGSLNKPPNHLLTSVNSLRAQHRARGSNGIPDILSEMLTKGPRSSDWTYHSASLANGDLLFKSDYDHHDHADGGRSCENCDQDELVKRDPRSDNNPRVHYGRIASGNRVMKHGGTRDRLSKELGVLCFEMEAAGLMDNFPCLVIRGICDYSDSHKADGWHPYAAVTAAAYAKEFIKARPADCNLALTADSRTQADAPNQPVRRDSVLKSLRFHGIDSRKSNIKAACDKTCTWFLKHKDYMDWQDPEQFSSHKGLLWISGKPGAGKSTMMKFISRKTKKPSPDSAIISFFFNARGEELEKTTVGMHRSLLFQLWDKFPHLQDVFNDQNFEDTHEWQLEDLKDLFRASVSRLNTQKVVCFIDALDECAEDKVREMLRFFEYLGEEALRKSIRFYVCFSSRHYPQIKIPYGLQLTLEGQAGHREDLVQYVREHFQHIGKAKGPYVVSEILRKASGVFMWVVLVVDILNKEYERGRMEAVLERLETIPEKLHDLFRELLTRDRDNLDELLLCIRLVLYAKRPLRREEFYFALLAGLEPPVLIERDNEITPNDMDLRVVSSSKGLAEVTRSQKGGEVVQFIHESVRDFLIKGCGLQSIWPELGESDVQGDSHDILRQCCQAYFKLDIPGIPTFPYNGIVSSEDLQEVREDLARRFPFLEYATKQLLYHSEAAAQGSKPQDQFLDEFAHRLQDWIHLHNLVDRIKSHEITRRADVLHIFVNQNLPALTRAFLQRSLRVIPGEILSQRLHTCINKGHVEVAEALLNYGSSGSNGRDWVTTSDRTGRCPLAKSAEKGQLKVVLLLLKYRQQFERDQLEDVLHQAIKKGNNKIAMAFFNTRRSNAGIDAVDAEGFTALHEAIAAGDVTVVKFLIKMGADINLPQGKGLTPLHLAIRNRRGEIGALLLENGANPNHRDRLGRTALHRMCKKERIVATYGDFAYKLTGKSEINALDKEHGTALMYAADGENEDFVAHLLEMKADPDLEDSTGTALDHAMKSGRASMVEILRRLGTGVARLSSTSEATASQTS